MTQASIWLCLLIVTIAAIVGFRARKTDSYNEFWLNDRNTKLGDLIFTIVSTQVGAGTVLGIAASTYTSGTGFGLVALISTISGFITLAFLAPWIKKRVSTGDIVTLPEFIGLQFGKIGEIGAAIITTIAYIGLLASQIVALGAFLNILGLNSEFNSIWIAGIGAVLYCAFSGLRGDIAADRWFFGVMLVSIILGYIILYSLWPESLSNKIEPRIISPVTFGGYTYLIGGIILGAIVPIVSMELWMRIFASEDAHIAKKSLIISAIIVIPFYLLPILLGIIAVTEGFKPKLIDGVFLEYFTAKSPILISTYINASITAVILSTANTYILVIAGVLTRNILPLRDNLKIQKIFILMIGIVATAVAFLSQNIVSLILGAFYVIIALFPAIIATINSWKINSWILSSGMIFGGITAIAAFPFIGAQAFIPALLISSIITFAGHFIGK